MTHMFDAMGALALFEVAGENSSFSGAYYPTRSYKIWNFHDRDFSKSSVAWGTFFSTVNVSAVKNWDPILTDFGKEASLHCANCTRARSFTLRIF